jgi:hypothetical protein
MVGVILESEKNANEVPINWKLGIDWTKLKATTCETVPPPDKSVLHNSLRHLMNQLLTNYSAQGTPFCTPPNTKLPLSIKSVLGISPVPPTVNMASNETPAK